MIVLSLFSWWYGRGGLGQIRRVSKRVDGIMEFFSVGQLAKTLFDPFRQIDAQPKAGPRRQALFDQIFSRCMGFVVRSFTIIFGLIATAGVACGGMLQVLIWPLAPLTPLAGLVLAIWKVGV